MSAVTQTFPAAVASRSTSTSTLSERTLWLIAMGCGASSASVYYNQPLLEDFARYFQASPAQAGWVAMAAQAGYGLGMLFFLPLGDLLERRKLVSRLILCCMILMVAIAAAPSLPLLVVLHLLMGATAVSTHILIPLSVELSAPGKQGRTVGLIMAWLLAGILLGRALAGFVGDHFHWRVMYGLAALILLVLALMLRKVLPVSPPSVSMPYKDLMLSLWDVWKTQPKLRPICWMSSLSFAGFSAFWTTLSFLMVENFQRGASEAGLMGVVGMVGAMGAPLAGKFSDRHGARLTIQMFLGVTMLSFILMGYWVTIPMLILGVILMDLGIQAAQVAAQSTVISLLPEARSRLNAVYMVIRFGGGAMSSLAGTLAWTQYRWPGVCGLAAILTLLAFITYGRGRVEKSSNNPPADSAASY